MTSLIFILFQAYEGVNKMVDLNPPGYSKLWEITKRVQNLRESNGPGPGDFIDRINELSRRVQNGEFPSLTTDQVTGQVSTLHPEDHFMHHKWLNDFLRALLLWLLVLRQLPTHWQHSAFNWHRTKIFSRTFWKKLMMLWTSLRVLLTMKPLLTWILAWSWGLQSWKISEWKGTWYQTFHLDSFWFWT